MYVLLCTENYRIALHYDIPWRIGTHSVGTVFHHENLQLTFWNGSSDVREDMLPGSSHLLALKYNFFGLKNFRHDSCSDLSFPKLTFLPGGWSKVIPLKHVQLFLWSLLFQGSNSSFSYAEQVRQTVDCDYFGLRNVCKRLFPLLRPYAR